MWKVYDITGKIIISKLKALLNVKNTDYLHTHNGTFTPAVLLCKNTKRFIPNQILKPQFLQKNHLFVTSFWHFFYTWARRLNTEYSNKCNLTFNSSIYFLKGFKLLSTLTSEAYSNSLSLCLKAICWGLCKGYKHCFNQYRCVHCCLSGLTGADLMEATLSLFVWLKGCLKKKQYRKKTLC